MAEILSREIDNRKSGQEGLAALTVLGAHAAWQGTRKKGGSRRNFAD